MYDMTEEKEDRNNWQVFLGFAIVVLAFLNGITWIMMATMKADIDQDNEQAILRDEATVEQLNQIAELLHEIGDKDEGISESPLKHQLDLDFNKTTGRLSFVYYDNHLEKLKGSPDFTPENWTYMGQWILDQHSDTFTQTQKNGLLYMLANLAYYNETGTWLGE
jgi:hypothetical protein